LSEANKEEKAKENNKSKAVAEFETVDAKGFMDILRALNVVTDEPTIDVEWDKMVIKCLDPSRVAMAYFILPKDMFDEWHVHTPGKAAFYLENVLKEVNKFTKDTKMRVFIDSKDRFLTFTLTDTRKRERPFELIEVSTEDLPVPKIYFNAKFKLLAKDMHEDLKDLSEKGCDHVHVETLDGDLIIVGIKDERRFTNTYRKRDGPIILDADVLAESKATYNLSWLPNMVRPELCDVIALEFATDKPMKISHCGKGTFIYYMAPRIETETP